uniref:Centrosomal protein 350 n=1 Tax=Mastacembelus armatus TaxID=205130 RepID=A0A3Q3LB14_9TELE
MRSTRRTEVSLKNPAQQLTDHNIGTELTAAWKSLAQSKAALRHIENRLEAAPGTGVLLESVMDPPKKKSSRMVSDNSGGSSKRRGRSQQSPEKSSSRSPLRNTTQDSNVRRNNSVDFREPLVSYREATPPSSQLEAYSLHSAPGSLYPSSPPPSDPLLSRLVYQRDTRDKQTDRDLDSTHSSALESTEVRYLNDQPTSPCLASASASATMCRGESTPSTSPGSASQRLENLRRHQPDDKLEKLKERIRRQRQHLEEAAEREKLLGNLEQPVMTAVGSSYTGTSNMPTAKIRKVAAAPPAPIYKGFNSTETKIRTPDGKVWKEEEFHNLSREIYRDLTRQFAESTRHQQQREQRADRSKERRPPKPVRKVHRAAPASDLNAKPVISPASWREGQKLVKMVLGPIPKLHGEEDQPHSADRQTSCGRSSSHPHPESNRQSHLNGTEQPRGGFQSKSHSRNTSTPSSGAQDKGPVGISTGLLSADIQGILDDLQLECKASEEEEERARQRGCRSASPTTRRPETADIADARHKKRHYDADTVRQYIARQQEERKRRQAEEKRALREEVERRNQRLQELYKRQREVAKTVTLPSEVPVAPVQKRLQETYTKLLLEEAQLGDKAPQTQPRPIYQPSGESDKENKRLEAAQSPSSSDRSLNDHLPPPLRRGDLDIGVASLLQPDHLSPAARPAAGPSSSGLAPFGEHFLSQLFKLDTAVPTDDIKHTHRPATAPSNRSHSKMSRIEALKATAASLSNRIESEARKLVGEGVNYGTATSMDIDTVLAPGPSHTYLDGCWAEAAATQNNDMDLRLQRVLTSTGQSSYNGAALSGAGKGMDNMADLHDSSAGSISEGPILSEGSLSEDEASPPHPFMNHAPRAADRLGAVEYCAGQRTDYLRLSEFQREAEKCSTLKSPFVQQDNSKAAWDELNRGSPLSVINIFTKNLQGHWVVCCVLHSITIKLRSSAGTASDQSDATLVEEQRSSCSPPSEALSSDSRKRGSDKSSAHSQDKSVHSSDTLGETSGHSPQSAAVGQLHPSTAASFSLYPPFMFLSGELQYSPAVLQQRMAAELQYLESIEESVRQLDNMEKLMGLSMAQQESASLAQMLKAKQQQHERDLYELKIKAEREALETKLQLEENRQRVARAHIELQGNLVASQKEALDGVQEATTKMMSQQAEAAQYTADAARHIKEVSNHCLTLCLENSPKPYCHYLMCTEDESVYMYRHLKCFVDMKVRVHTELFCFWTPGDSTSVATEYSLKFDESMTEDEIEERSFRSLLPSEAHRRGTMEKKPRTHEESEDDGANHNTRLVSGDVSMAFSSGQDSFSQFTMDMVRQYMKDEEVRLQHQSALLRLRQKALKEKTRTELAWLEHQKKRLRDKGEDDKMPPIRKKQRGLLMKLQQEQAEIKRLQEANKAAMKERQLLLKQQEEIERMRNSTLRLKERLKSAGETPVSEPAFPSMTHANDNRSPSPSLSVSGSETSSIMQKLKKMHSHMDEKHCSPVHYFFSMFTAHHWASLSVCLPTLHPKFQLFIYNQLVRFLTKREQQLMQRRRHAEELLQWKQRLDQEEAEVRRMEKEALAVWDRETPGNKEFNVPESQEKECSDMSSSPRHHQSSEPRTDSEKGSHSPAGSPSDGSSKTKMQLHSSARTSNQAHSQQTDSPMPISDQSDIESRIKALKEELRKRKFMAYQLKKEQKKRHKERLKAQEASLLKQLETYNNIIEKTKAELNKEPDSAPDNKSTSAAEDSTIKSAVHRSENSKLSERTCTDLDHSASTSVPEELSDEDPPTVTPSLVHGSPDYPLSGLQSLQSAEALLRPSSHEAEAQIIESGAEILIPDKRADIQEELEVEASSGLDHRHSEHVFKLEDRLDSQEKLSTSKHASSSMSEEHGYSRSEAEDVVKPTTKSHSAEIDFKTSAHPSRSTDPSCSPHSGAFSSQKEPPIKDAEASSLLADGYHDDFESSVDLSPREEHHSSKAESQISVSTTEIRGLIKDSPVRNLPYDSQEGKVEEEIAEELSDHSEASEPSQRSFRLLDLHKQTEDSKHDHQSINSSLSPPISPLQTALTAVTDVMPDFNIGDRVLVGGVQPGTLRFKGPTSFANGFWAGVELDKSEGSNNGTYDGVVYFECNESHGIFAPPEKITHLPDKFEMDTDITEDEDSFFDDLSGKGGHKRKPDEDESQKQGNLKSGDEQTSLKDFEPEDNKVTDDSVNKSQAALKAGSHLNSLHHKESKHLIPNGSSTHVILDFEDAPATLLISDMDQTGSVKPSQKEITDLVEREDVDSQQQFPPEDLTTDIRDDKEQKKETDFLDTLSDKLFNNFITDTMKQLTEIKMAKEQKIEAANQESGDLCGEHVEDEEWVSSVEQKDGLPFFLPPEKEELSSPELCNRPESPVFGASGQEELAKRLAELELSRELLDELGDDQDWFDEDFGLSSRREQQRLKQKQREEEQEQAKTPPRPELPLPLPPKLPEQPAMVVPHSATEVEKMVHAATQEIWESCGLANEGTLPLTQLPTNPNPSQEYLGKEASGQDQEALAIRSYRKAVFDLTWEIIQEIFAEDPNADQPQWVKPQRVKSSFFHRVKTAGDLTKIQEFITAEVLKLYGLARDQSQKTDWQKMLKFGRKKRDRVDHILVQELHEEEAQWVNYDEDELFVKMQLADSIFDALLKDTANTLTLIYDKKARRDGLS